MNPNRVIPVVFGANSTLTVPLPLPEIPDGKVSHETFADALHVQPVGAVTAICWVPPATLRLVGDTMMLQMAPACVTCTALSAIATVADRGDDVGLAAMVSETAPAPDPPEVLSVIHETGEVAVQEQPSPADTNTLLAALPPFTFTAVGDVE
jgi:hypothetical protein